jgi:hypothetical protein
LEWLIFEVEFIIKLLVGSWQSLQATCNQFREMFPEFLVTFDAFQQHCMGVVEHYVTKQKPNGRLSTLNEEVVKDIRTRMQRNPNTFTRRLSLQTGLFLSSSFLYQFVVMLFQVVSLYR